MAMVTYDAMEFGAKLKMLMQMREHRYSQESLARELEVSHGIEVSQNLVSLWTRGKSFPDIRAALALSKVFGVSVDYLAHDEMDVPPVAEMTDRERMVWEAVKTIGAEDAWKILVGFRTVGAGQADVLTPVVVKPGEEGRRDLRKGAG